jgi:flagellar motility protein MotE (MotC chaperone)
MNRKQAARVLALLPPEHAAATLTLNAGTQR